ncbi:hypothetical protein Taro_054830 [Colocasia esculenta]|uniref:Uncharacterized protein n=1 Tax=Colocasia esculenta TaxID=4460 RepID=A0A843XPQ4_COLES|nr:hypothetical protein [Colocasia esculenta]
MQTQAHTQAALQGQMEAQERADVWWASLLRTRFEDGAIDVAWDEFCGSSDHKIKDCPRLQQGVQRGAPTPAAVAAAAPATGRVGRPRAPAQVFALAREDAEQAEYVTEGLAADPTSLEETVESDSERGE